MVSPTPAQVPVKHIIPPDSRLSTSLKVKKLNRERIRTIDGHITFILTQNAAKLEAESYTPEKFITLLSELAAATWKPQDSDPIYIDAEAARASAPEAGATAFVQLCVDCGFLVRADAGRLKFRDSWLHGYLAARGLVHFLGLASYP